MASADRQILSLSLSLSFLRVEKEKQQSFGVPPPGCSALLRPLVGERKNGQKDGVLEKEGEGGTEVLEWMEFLFLVVVVATAAVAAAAAAVGLQRHFTFAFVRAAVNARLPCSLVLVPFSFSTAAVWGSH